MSRSACGKDGAASEHDTNSQSQRLGLLVQWRWMRRLSPPGCGRGVVRDEWGELVEDGDEVVVGE